MGSFRHPVYYSEKQICDIIEDNSDYIFNPDFYEKSTIYREVELGGARADFLHFHFMGNHAVEVYEVKISANIETIRQVVHYKRIVEEYVRVMFSEHNLEIPKFYCNIIALNIDQEIVSLCSEFEIGLFKLKLGKNSEILSFDLIDEYFPRINMVQSFQEVLTCNLKK